MWSRKRIEIGWPDLLFGFAALALPGSHAKAQQRIRRAWGDGKNVLVGLTERSCLDLMLSELQLPAASEILVSAVTIEGVLKVLKSHQLVPVPVDISLDDFSPNLKQATSKLNDRTKAILVAHLFGGRFDMEPIVSWARTHNLAVWEDCAQCLDNRVYRGNPNSNAALFSFGPIKAKSALGGGLIRVNSPQLARRMNVRHLGYTIQSRRSYVLRQCKYSIAKLVSYRRVLGLCLRILRVDRKQRDDWLTRAFRNLPNRNFLQAIRRRPSIPLLKMVCRRISARDAETDGRRARGKLLASLLAPRVFLPGQRCSDHSFWVFPICVDSGAELLLQVLDRHGFDATPQCQLVVVPSACESVEPDTPNACWLLNSIVFIPCYSAMPEPEVRRLGQIVRDHLGMVPPAKESRMEASEVVSR